MTNTIKAGCGFWDTTHYPYGGKFSRAGKEGLPLASVGEAYSRYSDGSVNEYKCSTFDKRIVIVKTEFISEA